MCKWKYFPPLLRVITVHAYSMLFSHFLLPDIMHVWVWVCMGVWQRQSFSKELKAFIWYVLLRWRLLRSCSLRIQVPKKTLIPTIGNTKKSSDSGVLKLRVICKITQPDHYRMAKFCIWVQRTPGVFLFFIISSGVRRIFVGKALRLKDQKYYWTSREIRYPSTDNTKSSVRLKFELNTFMTWLVKYFT